MTVYKKSNNIQGKFIDKSLLKSGMKCAIVSETKPEPGRFPDPKTGDIKQQNIAKIKVEGIEGEFNINVNQTTIYGLIDAFGEDSVNWQGNSLTVEIKDGTNGIAIFLIADGYKLIREKVGDKTYLKVIKNTLEEQLKT